VKARASRTAWAAASVPEAQKRTRSAPRRAPHNLLGERQRGRAHVGEVGAAGGSGARGLEDDGMGVAQQHRAPAHGEVGEGAPLGIPHRGAVAAGEHHRELGKQVVLTERSRRKHPLGPLDR
jgi:hypothetical protein